MRRFFLAAALALAALVPAACDERRNEPFRILAGSEVRPLEPMIREWAAANRVAVEFRYAGSLDIRRELSAGRDVVADAVWPAHGMWAQSGDSGRVLRDEESVMRSPVVVAVRQDVTRRLGWDRASPSVAEVAAAAAGGRLRLGITSATQSNSGAQAWLGFLHGLSGRADALRLEDLDREDVRDGARRILSSVQRASGSSAWLGDFVAENPDSLDGFVNYEAVLVAVNRRLASQGKAPFVAVYPRDGLAVADHALSFVARPGAAGEEARRKAFEGLRDFLLSAPAQARIAAEGWRTGRVGLEMPDADRSVFRPDWGLDPTRPLTAVRMPAMEVVEAALDLWQGGGLRKPSWTVILYDVSGSMNGDGISQARAGLASILDQGEARRAMLQAGPRDVLRIVPFRDRPDPPREVRGNEAEEWAALLRWVLAVAPGGGTDFHTPLVQVLPELEAARREGYLPAVVLMTDGQGDEVRLAEVRRRLRSRPPGENIPVFGILFGAAERRQLDELAALTGGRVFDGRRDLVRAFRDARGYN